MAEQTHDGFAADRISAERIWDKARREVREQTDAEIDALREQFRVEIGAERVKWRRLVELLEQPKSDARKQEIDTLKTELIGNGD